MILDPGFRRDDGWEVRADAGLNVSATRTYSEHLAAVQGGLLKSVGLLALYSLGLAVPFLLTSAAIGRFFAFYTRIRQHLHKIEVASGVIMMALGVLVVSGHFLMINGWLNKLPFFQNIVEKFL